MHALDTIKKGLNKIKNKGTPTDVFLPVFCRLTDASDHETFLGIIETPSIVVVDKIEEQISELIKLRNPSKRFTQEELHFKINEHTNGIELEKFGVWVYYPWSNRLVHLLDEKEFIEVRTSRNQYKITPKERDVLATKKIGVIGLSVGQSVSVTLAMERICGELRLADFDTLELTNLNRIRTGVHNLGLPKVYSVAREIFEIDPFLKVKCFPQGLHELNMQAFFSDGGNIDLLVEESDGFDIKILSRHMARDLKIPVVMEGSDRCVLDIERFDLEPEREILHGLVNHLDIPTLKTLKTNEQKIPYMLDLIGLNTSSRRLKASMVEIEQTITTWPQLASAVTMGGGITADVIRRILLNSFNDSGRYHVDVEELICDKSPNKKRPSDRKNEHSQVKSLDYFADLAKRSGIQVESKIDQKTIELLVSAGCQAPSGGNLQPWRWIFHNGVLFLFNGIHVEEFLGFDSLTYYVSLGAAAQNIICKANELGLQTDYNFFPKENISELIMTFSFSENKDQSVDPLSKMIGSRLTNRNLGIRELISEQQQLLLKQEVKEKNISLNIFTSDSELDKLSDVLSEIERIRLLEPLAHKDFVSEIRWTEKENKAKKDGIDLRTIQLTNTEKVGFEIARDAAVVDLLDQWEAGGAFKKLTKKAVDAASAVGLLTIKNLSKVEYVKGGMALQRVWLRANLEGISFQPMSVGVFLFARLLDGKGVGMSPATIRRLNNLRPTFEQAFLLPSNERELFIFRLSKASPPTVLSLRRPLKELFAHFT